MSSPLPDVHVRFARPVRSLKRRTDGRTPDTGPNRTNRTETDGQTGQKRTDLSDRIRAMATRWRYSPDDLEAALECAARDPAGWLRVVEADERMTETRPRPETEEAIRSLTLETETMLTVSADTAAGFELPPAAAVAARCCLVADLGSQESTFEGKTRMQRKILLSWELAELRSDGTPFRVSRRFGLSLHENSGLRAFLQAWRGRAFSDDELAGFDLSRLAGAACLLNLAHVSRAGRDYANILSVSPLPKGMTAPELSAPPVVFDIDAQNAPDVLETLSESLQATIAASPEWKARLKTLASPDREPGSDDEPFPNDIAF